MLRIALAQINTTVGDLEGNYTKIVQYLEKARKMRADMIAFPELAITGYPPEDLLLKNHFVNDNGAVLNKIIPHTNNITAIVGFVDRDYYRHLYNAAAVIHHQKLKGVYRKKALPNYGVFDEKRYFEPGKENILFALGEIIFGVSICEDIWTPEGPCDEQGRAGADLLINISASPYHFGKGKLRDNILQRLSRSHNLYVAYSNLVGGQDELVFDGGSMVYHPSGLLIASAKQFEEELLVVDIRPEDREKARSRRIKNIPVINLPVPERREDRHSVVNTMAKRMPAAEEIFKALVLATRDYVQKNGFQKVVVGLSGGIDSSLVAIIAREAVGAENVVGISMPSQYTSKATKSDAKRLAENLGIRLIEVPIQGIFNTYLFVLRKEFAGQKFDLTEENLQARIRGNILMAFSNKFGWLVLTTGNKSEIAVGYCTLYGDMSGGFAVIKDVPKTRIYGIARFLRRKYGPLIPDSVLKRPPTAELRKNQKDQDTLPPYEFLDKVLKSYVEEHRSVATIIRKNDHPEIIKNVVKMVDRSEYKRRQAPPGVKITPRAFGKDWRLPITNKYKDF